VIARTSLSARTLEAIAASGVELEASDLSIDRSAAMFLVSGEPAAIRRLWSIVEATGLENAWESFGAQLDWQVFEMSR
jgi:hypothetical protein